MSTGPWHYAEAERLLAVCAGPQRGSELDVACTAAAQVHATLAAAAATALSRYSPETGFTGPDAHAWYVAASEGPGEKQRQTDREQVSAS